jgi:signal transduction histidine kinase
MGDAKQLLHDARNHVSNLSGLGLMLAQASRHPEAALLERCLHNETQQLVHLLESLGAVAQGGRVDECDTAFDAAEHLLVLAHGLAPLACGSGAVLNAHVPPAPVPAVGKPRRLHRLLGNLVRNAIEHARAARIDVVLEHDAHGLRYTVRDDGVGIGRTRCGEHPPGRGLEICRTLAHSLGATLAIGDAAGGGTEATLRISGRTSP